jgi:hypothetical protein
MSLHDTSKKGALMSTDPRIRKVVDEVSKKLVDEGLIIEAGFVGYRRFVLHADAPQIQIDETRWAFFAGAQHLFASIMSVMDSDKEPTAKDMQRMDQIHAELQTFARQIELRIKTKGNA